MRFPLAFHGTPCLTRHCCRAPVTAPAPGSLMLSNCSAKPLPHSRSNSCTYSGITPRHRGQRWARGQHCTFSLMGSGSEAAQRGMSAETLLTFVTGAVLGYAVRAIGWAGSKSKQSSSSPQRKTAKAPASSSIPLQFRNEPFKMVLCVNNGLGMGKGKIGAQCAHAAVGVLERYKAGNVELFRMWERQGQPKITLKVKDIQEMAELAAKAKSAGLPLYIVHDAGRTQVAAGSQTVLAVGPGPASLVDSVTGHLSLM